MTFMGYSYNKETNTIEVVQDTLATKTNPRIPMFCVQKTTYHVNQHALVSSTGDLATAAILPRHLKQHIILDYADLVNTIHNSLSAVRTEVLKNFGVLTRCTIFVFGFNEEEVPQLNRFSLEKGKLTVMPEDLSSTLLDEKIRHKPDLQNHQQMSQKFLDDHKNTINLLRTLHDPNKNNLVVSALVSHLNECNRPINDPNYIGIGGEVLSYKINPYNFKGRIEAVYGENKFHGVNTKLLHLNQALHIMYPQIY